MQEFMLSNGVKMPCIGYGTWRMPEGEICVKVVKEAIECGYRHIDTAAIYENEKSVGKAVKESNVKREELFITSKLWNSEHTYAKTLAAFEKTLNDLQLDYLDLYLIHWPVPVEYKENWEEANNEVWRAFEKLYKDCKVRAIGVSNFMAHHLDPLIKNASIVPMVNQIEINPGFLQNDIIYYCEKHNILVEAWAPFAVGRAFGLPELKMLSEKYKRPIPQIILKWLLQKNIVPLPKSITTERIKENLNLFDFVLSSEDIEAIDNINTNLSSGLNPDNIDF